MTNVNRDRSVCFREKGDLNQGIIREDGLSSVHGIPEADVNKEWSEAGIGNAFIFGDADAGRAQYCQADEILYRRD